jgi:aldehyde:ferredoxin oxidoreductase
MDLSSAVWRKSSYSGGNGGGCVEVARNLPAIVAVRDSKNVPGPELTVSGQAWSEFVEGIKRGEFDL